MSTECSPDQIKMSWNPSGTQYKWHEAKVAWSTSRRDSLPISTANGLNQTKMTQTKWHKVQEAGIEGSYCARWFGLSCLGVCLLSNNPFLFTSQAFQVGEALKGFKKYFLRNVICSCWQVLIVPHAELVCHWQLRPQSRHSKTYWHLHWPMWVFQKL